MNFTVENFIKSYKEFDMGRRKNQNRLTVIVRDVKQNKNVYAEDMAYTTLYMGPEIKNMVIKSWTYDYTNRKIILFINN